MVSIILLIFYSIKVTATQYMPVDPCNTLKIDAMIWTHKPNEVLLFVDQYFWKYDTAKKDISKKTVINKHWKQVKGPVDAATTVLRGKGVTSTYFIKDNTYSRFDNFGTLFSNMFIETGTVNTEFGGDIGAVTIIAGILGEEGTNAVVCDKNGKNIYFCSVNYAARTLTFNKCSTQPSKKLPEGSCEALSKNSDSTYLIAGRITMIQSSIGTVKTDREFAINEIFDCEKGSYFLVISLIALVAVIFIVLVYAAVTYFKRRRKQSNQKTDINKPRNVKGKKGRKK